MHASEKENRVLDRLYDLRQSSFRHQHPSRSNRKLPTSFTRWDQLFSAWQWSDGLSRMFTKFKSVAHVGWHSLGGKYKDSFCELKGIHKGDLAANDHCTAAAAEYARLCVNEHRGQQVHKM